MLPRLKLGLTHIDDLKSAGDIGTASAGRARASTALVALVIRLVIIKEC